MASKWTFKAFTARTRRSIIIFTYVVVYISVQLVIWYCQKWKLLTTLCQTTVHLEDVFFATCSITTDPSFESFWMYVFIYVL
jgi:hypothetical protein